MNDKETIAKLEAKIQHLEAEIDDLIPYREAIQLITYGKSHDG